MAQETERLRHRECALCLGQFTSPRLLPCFHTFCLECLKQLVKSQKTYYSFSCPTCRTKVSIPIGGIDKFQVNFYIEADLESQKHSNVSDTCDMCKKNSPSTHKCVDCDQFAFQTCIAVHNSISSTKSHGILDLQNASAKSAMKVSKDRYCLIHAEEKIRFFCTKCSTVICRDCKLTAHEGHSTTNLFDKSSEAQRLILQVTKNSSQKLKGKLQQLLQEAKDHQTAVQKQREAIESTLESRAASLKADIDKSLAEAKQTLKQEAVKADIIISQTIDGMTGELACLSSLTEHAQSVSESGCDADILELPTQMKQFFGSAKTGTKVSKQLAADSKLKSFISDEWKVSIALESEVIKEDQCLRCPRSCRKGQKTCYICGDISEKSYQSRVQCKTCSQTYIERYLACPNCGKLTTSLTEQALTAFKKNLPDYICHVITRGQSQTVPSENAILGEVITEINAIQTVLSGWQAM